MKFILVLSLVVGVITVISAFDRYENVNQNCGNEIQWNDDDSELHLNYNGETFSDKCKITIKTDEYSKKICSKPKKFDLKSCAATVEYHKGIYSSYSSDEEYTCTSKQYSTFCTTFSTLVIVFDKTSSGSFARSDNVELVITLEDNDFSGIVDAAVTTVYVIIGVIIAVVVIVIILVVVVVVCCCRKRRSQAGTVYRAPAQAATTTVAYPMTQPGYQPQAGYGQPGFQQPPPQGGFQQPPPPMGFQQPPPAGFQQYPPTTGYQQPPGAYPPAPQQGYAGYQTGAGAPFTDKASAPPVEPPPYSG